MKLLKSQKGGVIVSVLTFVDLLMLAVSFVAWSHCALCSVNDDNLEDEMELRMERDGQRVTLRLKKNDHVRDDVPVYSAEQKVDTTTMPVSVIPTLQSGQSWG